MQTIYEPKGRAREYGELALNIYTGCPHGCTYCYAPQVLKKDRNDFHTLVQPRNNIVKEVEKRLAKGDIKDKLIHLCFTCDPYPKDCDTSATRDIIALIKDSGNHVQILTKNYNESLKKDMSMLDIHDKFGVTISGGGFDKEPNAASENERLYALHQANLFGIPTFVSCEPVYDTEKIFGIIANCEFIDEYRIGKLNYASSHIDWTWFGNRCVELCKEHNRKYYIKEDLRKLM